MRTRSLAVNPIERPPRRITAGLADAPADVDVVVIGLGVTGAGVALDAISRGLSVLAVDAHDLAFGTSRFSSKLAHGGLRYLASLQIRVAHESAVERDILIRRTAPHLVRPMPFLLPELSSTSIGKRLVNRAGVRAGDLLRRSAGTPSSVLPPPRHISVVEARRLVPALRLDGLRGALLGWDTQLEDDARLVINIARTAAELGAEIRTRSRVVQATGTEVKLRDGLTGETHSVRARIVINAAGAWAGELVDGVRLRPSRGTHLVLRAERLPGLSVCFNARIPGTSNSYVLALPQPDGTVYVGLTDVAVEGPIPDVPQASDEEIDFLLGVLSGTLTTTLTRDDVVGAYAGIRPLLDTADGATADLSRRHAVLTSSTGVTTIVGGKLTTYRRMAQDALDAAIERTGVVAGSCRTGDLPLLGAASWTELDKAPGHPRLVRRFGTHAPLVLENAVEVTGMSAEKLVAPIAEGVPVTLAELIFGITHEGACDVDDLLDRRSRVGLVPVDRERAVDAASSALHYVAASGATRAR